MSLALLLLLLLLLLRLLLLLLLLLRTRFTSALIGGPLSHASAAAAEGIDPSALRAELARIDEQVSRAMQLISDAQQAELGTAAFGKEGRA